MVTKPTSSSKNSQTHKARPHKPNRTKTLLRQIEKKKQTIQNIRNRKKEKMAEDKKYKLLDKLANTLGNIIGGQ